MKALINKKIISDYCHCFQEQDEEPYHGDIPNSEAADFLEEEIPCFEYPDPIFEEIWYFRWWSFRKHIKSTPFGRVILEFMPDVPWAGAFNTINCPAAHQLREARWLNNKSIAEEYLAFYLNPDAKASIRRYTFGPAAIALELESVTGHTSFTEKQYPVLRENYIQWKKTNLCNNGFFIQEDDLDGMECSIGGSGYRTTINSCIAAEAKALFSLAKRTDIQKDAELFHQDYEKLRDQIMRLLWNDKKDFFMTRRQGDFSFVNVRELHGYSPWYYLDASDIPEKYDCAWKQLNDSEGFQAPYGPTTAERRHPGFILDRTGHECQWNGPSWPFATAQTLTALEKLLHSRRTNAVSSRVFFDVLACYTRSHYLRENGRIIPWIDENLDPFTGEWIARSILRQWTANGQKSDGVLYERGKDYSHSTYSDLIITGLCGLRTDIPGKIIIQPLIPTECREYFLLDGVRIRNHVLSVQYDRSGEKYNRGKGLILYVDGSEAAHTQDLLTGIEINL